MSSCEIGRGAKRMRTVEDTAPVCEYADRSGTISGLSLFIGYISITNLLILLKQIDLNTT